MRYVYLVTFFAVVLIFSIFGFRGQVSTRPPMDVFPAWAFPGMQYQPKYRPQAQSAFFADGRADRPLPEHVVARGDLREDDPTNLGKAGSAANAAWVRNFPIPVDARRMARGQERYDIYCAVCHGALGDGNGITKRYGMLPANLLDERIRAMAEGEIYNAITNGSPNKVMLPYADKLEVEDRWAVVAYVRALQRAAAGRPADVTDAASRKELGLP